MKKSIVLSLLFIMILTLAACNRMKAIITTTTTTTSSMTTNDGTSTTDTEDTNLFDEKVTISFWNPITGADGSYMRQLVQGFNEEYEGQIEVVETFTNEIDYYTNLNLLVPMGRGPEVAIMHSYLVQSYANRNLIVPIEDYIETSNVEINGSDYISDVFNSLYFENELYGVPLDIHVTGIYYNKDLLEKYDLEVPTNRDELVQTAKTVQEGETNLGNTVWGLPLSTVWPSEWIYTTALYQNNGLEIDSEGNPAFNSPEGIEALEAVTDLIHVHNLSPMNVSVDQDLFYFQTGKALYHIQGSWMLNDIIASGVNFGVIPLSNMFNDDGEDYSEHIHARSHTFVVPRQTKNVSDAKKTATMLFIKYLGDHSYIWAEAGQIPASNIARSSTEYQNLPYHSGFGDVDNFRVAAQSPYYHEAYSPVYSRVTSAMLKADYNASVLLDAAESEAEMLVREAKNN